MLIPSYLQTAALNKQGKSRHYRAKPTRSIKRQTTNNKRTNILTLINNIKWWIVISLKSIASNPMAAYITSHSIEN